MSWLRPIRSEGLGIRPGAARRSPVDSHVRQCFANRSMLNMLLLLQPSASQLDIHGSDGAGGGGGGGGIWKLTLPCSVQGRKKGGGGGSPQDRVALFCISFWLSSLAGLAEQRRRLHKGTKRTVSPNEEQLRGLVTAPHQ